MATAKCNEAPSFKRLFFYKQTNKFFFKYTVIKGFKKPFKGYITRSSLPFQFFCFTFTEMYLQNHCLAVISNFYQDLSN